jgi:hypothetical protein
LNREKAVRKGGLFVGAAAIGRPVAPLADFAAVADDVGFRDIESMDVHAERRVFSSGHG